MQHRYSIVFQPPLEIVEQVQNLKNDLATAIGWYASRNAIAHITIQEFVVEESKIDLIKRQLRRCTNSLHPLSIHFDDFDSFPNGAFFIKPDLPSHGFLSDIMKRIQKAVPTPNTHKGANPHLTIARRLNPESILIAQQLFPNISLEYYCNTIALRRFNETKKQFEIIDEFIFLGLPDTTEIQGSLF